MPNAALFRPAFLSGIVKLRNAIPPRFFSHLVLCAEKAWRDRVSQFHDAREEGIEKGIEKGRAEERVIWQGVVADKDTALAGKDAALAGKDAALAGKDAALAGKDAEIERLRAQLQARAGG